MSAPLVTILVPNYKTLELTKLCLRLLRKYTDTNKARVIVIDNDSQDASLDYLRTVSWIELIERKSVPGESPVKSHSSALDEALLRVTTPYVLSIHTDTLVKRADWLEFLIAEIEQDPNIAGVGSWKLEAKPFWKNCLKAIERQGQLLFYRLIGKKQHSLEGVGKNYYYLRSHCALYRTDLLRQHDLHFADGDLVAGKYMHEQLVRHGYQMRFLPSDVLIHYLDHINHATTILNPALSRQKNNDKRLQLVKRNLASMNAEMILQDASLDG
jgi:GT2 family glycosyltransferase